MEVIRLYKKDTQGRLRILKLTVIDSNLIQESGILNGKLTTNVRVCRPKNIGRSNETTGHKQAVAEAKSIEKRKLREGYFRTIEEAEKSEIKLPMLALKVDLSKLEYPVYVQPKLDGVRCLCINNKLMSRKNKEFDTVKHININIGDHILDGELYAHGLSFQDNMKLIKKYRKGESEQVRYCVYDLPSAEGGFKERYKKLTEIAWEHREYITVVPTYVANTEEELLKFHEINISEGFEGTIIRIDEIPYEYNKRSKQLLKLKDFIDEAYEIVDIVPSDRIPEQGVAVCKMENGRTFNCGMKMSHKDREEMLINKDDYIGKTAEVRFFEYTDDGLPRFPVFYGIRLDK